jgi:hypothetical protein
VSQCAASFDLVHLFAYILNVSYYLVTCRAVKWNSRRIAKGHIDISFVSVIAKGHEALQGGDGRAVINEHLSADRQNHGWVTKLRTLA